MANKHSLTTKEYLIPFIFISFLFFLWGIAHGMIDTLDKHFQQILQLTKSQSSMIQFSLYGAYFGMALPAGMFMRRFGYKKGIVFGLMLFATGAFLIAATTSFESFWIFLSCLFYPRMWIDNTRNSCKSIYHKAWNQGISGTADKFLPVI